MGKMKIYKFIDAALAAAVQNSYKLRRETVKFLLPRGIKLFSFTISSSSLKSMSSYIKMDFL